MCIYLYTRHVFLLRQRICMSKTHSGRLARRVEKTQKKYTHACMHAYTKYTQEAYAECTHFPYCTDDMHEGYIHVIQNTDHPWMHTHTYNSSTVKSTLWSMTSSEGGLLIRAVQSKSAMCWYACCYVSIVGFMLVVAFQLLPLMNGVMFRLLPLMPVVIFQLLPLILAVVFRILSFHACCWIWSDVFVSAMYQTLLVCLLRHGECLDAAVAKCTEIHCSCSWDEKPIRWLKLTSWVEIAMSFEVWIYVSKRDHTWILTHTYIHAYIHTCVHTKQNGIDDSGWRKRTRQTHFGC